jgi:hypothetical protein
LFFVVEGGKMMAVAVKALAGARPSFEAGTPQPLFEARLARAFNPDMFEYDVTADGKRFLLDTSSAGPASPPTLNVVLNWSRSIPRSSR